MSKEKDRLRRIMMKKNEKEGWEEIIERKGKREMIDKVIEKVWKKEEDRIERKNKVDIKLLKGKRREINIEIKIKYRNEC